MNLKEVEQLIRNAFYSGCTWGYGVEHTENVIEQETIGADKFIKDWKEERKKVRKTRRSEI